ncbi:MAG: hypothetical protein ACOYMA_06835 [Bacteroidia bacterium]
MKTKIPLFSLLLFAVFSNCKTEENKCLSIQQANITSTKTPAYGLKNTVIPIPIYYGIASGCGQFYSLDESTNGNTRTIKVNVKYEGCVCTAIAGTLETKYNFSAANAGIYYLKIMENNTSFHVDTIVIQ